MLELRAYFHEEVQVTYETTSIASEYLFGKKFFQLCFREIYKILCNIVRNDECFQYNINIDGRVELRANMFYIFLQTLKKRLKREQ